MHHSQRVAGKVLSRENVSACEDKPLNSLKDPKVYSCKSPGRLPSNGEFSKPFVPAPRRMTSFVSGPHRTHSFVFAPRRMSSFSPSRMASHNFRSNASFSSRETSVNDCTTFSAVHTTDKDSLLSRNQGSNAKGSVPARRCTPPSSINLASDSDEGISNSTTSQTVKHSHSRSSFNGTFVDYNVSPSGHPSKNSELPEAEDSLSPRTLGKSILAPPCTPPLQDYSFSDWEEESSPPPKNPKLCICGTESAYVFCHGCTNANYQVFQCIYCWKFGAKTSIRVIGDEFLEDPCKIDHICTPINELEDRVERLTHKWLSNLRTNCGYFQNSPKELYANFLTWLRNESDTHAWTRRRLVQTFKKSGGFEKHEKLFSTFCKPKKVQKNTRRRKWAWVQVSSPEEVEELNFWNEFFA
ncbi:unnamed protein product [Cylicocyclus nassatus]|uniref:Uncharacterized protein n=1 Tax=Cylicocyclus nassatus TaxID=53992 RepID=A0AA36HGU8_CYLNA|nr:unnamed protein product [Cylicocyclus nassatus]